MLTISQAIVIEISRLKKKKKNLSFKMCVISFFLFLGFKITFFLYIYILGKENKNYENSFP